MPDELIADLVATGVAIVPIDTGDPGTANDLSTPLESLPDYQGPPEPVAGPLRNGAQPRPRCPMTRPSKARPWPRTAKPPTKPTSGDGAD